MKTTSEQVRTPNPSTPEATRTVPFDLPLQRGDYGDDICDDRGVFVANLYGDERDPKTAAKRDYILRAVNSYDDMLAALKFVKEFFRKMEDHDRRGDPLIEIRRKYHAPVHAQIEAAIAKAEAQ